MKILLPALTLGLVVLGSVNPSVAAESKRTAEYLLSSPLTYEGKDVTVDVAMVRPVSWKSPLPEIMFFQAMTTDRYDHKAGGVILVAVSSDKSASFAKKYGTDFDGRHDSDTLRGLFTASGPHKIWVIDTTGKLNQLMAERRAELPGDARQAMGGMGGARGMKGEFGGRPGKNR